MGKKRLRYGPRKRGTENITLNRAVAQQWKDIGNAHNLTSDSEIAALLLRVYEKKGGDVDASVNLCIGCNKPLPRYLCSGCSTGGSSTIAQRTPLRRGRKRKNAPVEIELQLTNVKAEKPESEGESVSRRSRKITQPSTAVDDERSSSVAAEEGDGAMVVIAEVKVESLVSGDEDVKPVLDEDEEDGSTLPIMFDEDKPHPSLELLDDDTLLTDEASEEPAPEPGRKRGRPGRKAKDKTTQKFECKHCNAIFYQAYRLKRHSKIHAADHGKDRMYSCEECRMSFRLKGSLDAHMRTHSGQQLYVCALCNLPFVRAKQSKEHVQSQHADSFGVVPCFRCALCQAEFTLYKKFTTHIWRHTLERKFQCEYCSMAFFEPSSLRVHQRVHTGDKPFTCSECGLSFHQLSNLNRHVLTHSGERPYRCTLCPATYPASQQLKRHLQSHRGEKPFLCQLCGASYTDSKSLKFHIRSHTGEKPFKCDQCDKEFARPASLRVHRRTHSSDRPYICALCGSSFADNSNLHRHHRLKHRGKPKKLPAGVAASSITGVGGGGGGSGGVSGGVSGGSGDGGGGMVSGGSLEPVSVCGLSTFPDQPGSSLYSSSKTSKPADLHNACSAMLEMGMNSLLTNSVATGVSGGGEGMAGGGGGGGGGLDLVSMGPEQLERLANQMPLLPGPMMSYAQALVPSIMPFRY